MPAACQPVYTSAMSQEHSAQDAALVHEVRVERSRARAATDTATTR